MRRILRRPVRELRFSWDSGSSTPFGAVCHSWPHKNKNRPSIRFRSWKPTRQPRGRAGIGSVVAPVRKQPRPGACCCGIARIAGRLQSDGHNVRFFRSSFARCGRSVAFRTAFAVRFDQRHDCQPDVFRNTRPRANESSRGTTGNQLACILLASCLHPNRSLRVLSGSFCSLSAGFTVVLFLQGFTGNPLNGRRGTRTLKAHRSPVFETGAVIQSTLGLPFHKQGQPRQPKVRAFWNCLQPATS